MADIREHVIDKGQSQIGNESELDWVFYQRGLTMSMMLAEAIRKAPRPSSTPGRRAGRGELGTGKPRPHRGAAGGTRHGRHDRAVQDDLRQPTGHGGGWIIEWNGEQFERVSEILQADRERITPLEEAEAQRYAESNAPWPTNEECDL